MQPDAVDVLPDPVPARMSLRHIRGTKLPTAPEQWVGTRLIHDLESEQQSDRMMGRVGAFGQA
jgi:hypothetical protein